MGPGRDCTRGFFSAAGLVAASRIAKWDGTNWSALGSRVDAPVQSLTVFDDGTGFEFTTNAAIGARGDNLTVSFLSVIDELSIYTETSVNRRGDRMSLKESRFAWIGLLGLLMTIPSFLRAQDCAPIPDGIVSWWPAEGDATDILGDGSTNGTLVGGVTFADGMVGQAFLFDGTDGRVEVPHNPNQNTGSQITIEAWVNPSTSTHGRTIVQKRSVSNVGGYVLETLGPPQGPDNALQFVIMIGGIYWGLHSPGNVLANDTWQHVAATYDGAAMKIYVNGVEVASASASGAIDAVTDPLVMGRNVVVPEPQYAWNGLIDEVSLYARALAPEEIQAIVVAGSAGKCQPQ
jgi:hypothetical protein